MHYLAIDIGASSGRHILGWVREGKLLFEEVHRFPNGMIEKNGSICWDLDALFEEILFGIKRCAELGKPPVSIGIDTWGVDFVLLDKGGNKQSEAIAYRDGRTNGMDEVVYRRMNERELYSRTGIAKQPFNTIFQLMAAKDSFRHAHKLLFIPDYLHYRLSGVAKTEYTIASTSGLLNAVSRDWDDKIIDACGFPRDIFAKIVPPGTCLGSFTSEIQSKVGFNAKVVTPASHDTGSAIMAVPSSSEKTLFISSGTWSLMGVELSAPDCGLQSMERQFSNEGGYDGKYRYLKTIMGLWMIQSIKKELPYTYDELCLMAEKESIPSIVDCNDIRFFSPKDMASEIQQACKESGQPIPRNPGELAAVIYNSLAKCYQVAVIDLENRTGVSYPVIHIVGGGSNAAYLNKLTELHTGKKVHAGPSEATAIGNLLAQMITDGVFPSLMAARECVKASFG